MQWTFVIAGICCSKVWRGMPSCVTGRNWHCRVCLCCIRGWKSHWSLFFSVGMFFCCLIYYCDTSGSFEEFSVVSSLKLRSVTVWDSWQVTEFPFFASKVQLGRTGAVEIFPLGPLNNFERWESCVHSCMCANWWPVLSACMHGSLKWVQPERCLMLLNFLCREALEKMKAELQGSIEKGVNFVHKPKSS